MARTVDRGGRSALVTVDLDERDEVVGIEMIGMGEFNLSVILKAARVDAPAEAVARARYVHAQMSTRGELETA